MPLLDLKRKAGNRSHRSGSRSQAGVVLLKPDPVHTDKASGARGGLPGLRACLDDLNAGDTLIVGKLDRLGRSLPHLLEHDLFSPGRASFRVEGHAP